MKGGRYGSIRKDATSRVWKGENDVVNKPALSKRGCWFFFAHNHFEFLNSILNIVRKYFNYCCLIYH